MLNETQKYFNDLLKKYEGYPEKIVEDILYKYSNLDNPTEDMTGIFSLCKKMGIRIVAIDYKDDIAQFVERGKDKKSYIFLNSTSNYRRLRFNAATLLYCALHSKHDGKKVVTKSKENQNLHRAKKFAAALLIPKKKLKNVIYEKDESGEYKYLVKSNDEYVIPFKNIHYIADRFGVEFETCAKRIFHSDIVGIRRIKDVDELKKRLQGTQANESTRRELIPDWAEHDYKLKCCLINNMHFPNIDNANEVVKERLRIESIKNDCVIEGVVSSTKGMDKFLAKYRADPEGMKEDMSNLSVAQRIMIGHYDTIRKLEKFPFNKFLVCDLHAEMFKYAYIISEEGEPLKFEQFGKFKTTQNNIVNSGFETDSPGMVLNTIVGLSYDIKDLIDNKDKYSNVDYITEVNYIARKFLVCHPFDDGNGRVSRLLMNYLFILNGLPPFFVNASKRKSDYISALEEIGDKTRIYPKDEIDFSKLNNVVIDSLIETQGAFYSAKAMIEDPEKTIEDMKKKR